MPMSREVKRLGRRWPVIVERAEATSKTLSEGGASLAVFVEAALADVSPHDVPGIVKALARQGVIWLRRNRGEVRVFAKRPEAIAGVFGGSDPAEACLAACTPHLCSATRALAARDEAKGESNFVEAEASRDRLSASCIRLVAIVRQHVTRGLPLDAFRATLWANWVPGTLEAVAIFEPALARDSKTSLAPVEQSSSNRIPAGLASCEKVAALVAKAGGQGVTKTGLRQSIRPKPKADELASILDSLAAEGRIETREVRIGTSARSAPRFFAGDAQGAV